MEIIRASALFIVTLDTLIVQAYHINMKSCKTCSNRVDVPCHIQELDYYCLHDELSGIWPGLPRNLTSRKVAVGSNTSVANFTWNAPYDASYKTLNGFLLAINIAQDYIVDGMHSSRLQEPHRCFFANLSGTNWEVVPKPHSVLFHFDCVTARAGEIVEVNLTLKSSPVPGEKSLTPVSSFIRLKQEETRYREPDAITLNFTINFTVVGLSVKVKFGPLKPSTTYRVCLISLRNEYTCYRDTRTHRDVAVFENVEADAYKIMIQRGDNSDFMYESKSFNVTEKPSAPAKTPIAPSVVAIITVGCLLCVAGVTTLCFCLMRERCRCLTLRCEMCSCFQYQPTSQSAPNNTNEREDDSVHEILPLFYEESENFTLAIEKICIYLRRWSSCLVHTDWMSDFFSNPAMSFREKHPNGILLIVLSCKMWKLLNNVFYDSNFQGQNDPKSKLFRRILMETDGTPYSKFIISLCPLTETVKYLKGIEIFRMTKMEPRQTQNILEMNTEELLLMLKLLNDEGVVQSGWAGYDELLGLHNALKYVPESDLYIDEHGDFSADTLDSYKQIVNLPSKKEQNVGMIQCASCSLCDDRHDEKMCPVRQKQTYKWASGCRNPYKQSGCLPAPVCYPIDDLGYDQSRDVDLDVESASVCQENIYKRETSQIPYHVGYPEFHSDPKDDTESISWSVIGQRQMEIYQDYKASMNDTKV